MMRKASRGNPVPLELVGKRPVLAVADQVFPRSSTAILLRTITLQALRSDQELGIFTSKRKKPTWILPRRPLISQRG